VGLANPKITSGALEVDMKYPDGFKMRMVQRLSGPTAVSANMLAEEVGVAQTTLSKWLRQASSIDQNYSQKVNTHMPKRPQDWTAEEKLQTVIEADSLSDEELGEFLRRKGIHEAQLNEWHSLMIGGLTPHGKSKSKNKSCETKKIKQLEKELHRKDKALAEASALLVLKKKAQEIWGDGDASTPKKNGKKSSG
jgi:transposase-like protein